MVYLAGFCKPFCYFIFNFYLSIKLPIWSFFIENNVSYFLRNFYKNRLENIYVLFIVFLSMLSKHVEHNKWPFLIQYVFVDLSISFLQIRHLNIGDILKGDFINTIYKGEKRPANCRPFLCVRFFNLDLRLRNQMMF